MHGVLGGLAPHLGPARLPRSAERHPGAVPVRGHRLSIEPQPVRFGRSRLAGRSPPVPGCEPAPGALYTLPPGGIPLSAHLGPAPERGGA